MKQAIKLSYQLQVQLFSFALMFALFLMPEMAIAQSSDGGLAKTAGDMLDNIAAGIQIVVGVVATIALMWQFADSYMGRKTWTDIFNISAWIIGAGAGIAFCDSCSDDLKRFKGRGFIAQNRPAGSAREWLSWILARG